MKSVFDTLPNMDEFFIGASEHMNQMFDTFSSVNPSERGYPPYNIIIDKETNDGRVYIIQIAVAGFKKEDLRVVLRQSDTLPKLEIDGVSSYTDPKVQVGDTLVSRYQYRGIAARKFQRRFILERGSKVTKVKVEDGMLNITILNPTEQPRQDSVEKLKIE